MGHGAGGAGASPTAQITHVAKASCTMSHINWPNDVCRPTILYSDSYKQTHEKGIYLANCYSQTTCPQELITLHPDRYTSHTSNEMYH